VIPELGLLASDFPDAFLKTFDLRNGRTARVAPGVEVRSSRASGRWACRSTSPGRSARSRRTRAGNVDCRHLVAGSTLWLPVWCEGALFSCGRRARRAARRRGVRHARCGTRSGSGTATGRSPGPLTRSRSRWGSPARTGARWASTPT
jgi:hypothetical protein